MPRRDYALWLYAPRGHAFWQDALKGIFSNMPFDWMPQRDYALSLHASRGNAFWQDAKIQASRFFPTYSVSYFPCCLSPLTIFCKIYTPAFLCRWWPLSTFLLPKFLKEYLKILHFRPFSIRFWPLSIHLSWPLSLHFNDLPITWKQ